MGQLLTMLMRRIAKDEKGQDLVEYGLLVTLIALAAIAVMTTLGTAINTAYTNAANQLGS